MGVVINYGGKKTQNLNIGEGLIIKNGDTITIDPETLKATIWELAATTFPSLPTPYHMQLPPSTTDLDKQLYAGNLPDMYIPVFTKYNSNGFVTSKQLAKMLAKTIAESP
jgi:hypothetical protein